MLRSEWHIFKQLDDAGTNRPWQYISRRSRRDVAVAELVGCGCGYAPEGLAYRDLEHKLLAIVVCLKGVENGRELFGIELDCRLRQLATNRSRQMRLVEAIEKLTIDNGTCFGQSRLAERTIFRSPNHRVQLTDDLVDLALTDTRSAGESLEGRGPDVQAGWANGATSRRREGRTGCPSEGGNAAAARAKKKLCISLN